MRVCLIPAKGNSPQSPGQMPGVPGPQEHPWRASGGASGGGELCYSR